MKLIFTHFQYFHCFLLIYCTSSTIYSFPVLSALIVHWQYFQHFDFISVFLQGSIVGMKSLSVRRFMMQIQDSVFSLDMCVMVTAIVAMALMKRIVLTKVKKVTHSCKTLLIPCFVYDINTNPRRIFQWNEVGSMQEVYEISMIFFTFSGHFLSSF